MIRKIAMLIIAIPTVSMLMSQWVSIGLVDFLAGNAAIFWAAGVALLLYSVLSVFWIFAGVVIATYLIITYIMGAYLPI